MEGFTSAIYDIVEGILSILPDSPFQFLYEIGNTQIGEWLKWVNWFIPFYTFVGILQAWLSAIIVWYVFQIALRWARAIE